MKVLFMFLLFLPQKDTVTLEYCYKQAYENHPVAMQKQLYQTSSHLKIDNLGMNYLPEISLSSQATYQSDVPQLNVSTPIFSFPGQSKDRYKLLLDVNQTVYDGGVTGSLQTIERRQLLADRQRVEVELYKLKQQINDLYFGILILQEKKRQLELQYTTVNQKLEQIKAQISNGLAAGNNRYILEAQLLTVEQEIINAESGRQASVGMLGELIGEELDEDIGLQIPSLPVSVYEISPGNRPEYELFNLEKNTLNAYKDKVSTGSMPSLGIFGQLGYGRPGLNFLDNSFKSYYTIGINLAWNPVNWGANSNAEQMYEVSKKMIDTQKETLDKNVKMNLERYKAEIENLQLLIAKDIEIIVLKEKIVSGISGELQSGAITATDYLAELNSETQAIINLRTHEIQLVQAKVNFITAKGN